MYIGLDWFHFDKMIVPSIRHARPWPSKGPDHV